MLKSVGAFCRGKAAIRYRNMLVRRLILSPVAEEACKKWGELEVLSS